MYNFEFIANFSFYAVLFALCASALLTYGLSKAAPRYNLVDRADGTRKDHLGTPALVGGLAIFLSVWLSLFLFAPLQMSHNFYFLIASFILVITGSIDDRYDIPALYKLGAQFIAALILVVPGKVALLSLGMLIPSLPPIALGVLSVPFTMLAIILLLNAWNMLDGLDGLLAGITLVSLFWLSAVVLYMGLGVQALILPLIIAAAIIGFMPFNTASFSKSHTAVFLGDAGSLFLGLAMAWIPLKLTQDISFKVSPIIIAWVLALPVFDLVCVTFKRLREKKSPLQADKAHLHHLLIDAGYDRTTTTNLMIRLCFIYGGFGVLTWIWGLPQYISFIFWAMALVLHFFLRRNLHKKGKSV